MTIKDEYRSHFGTDYTRKCGDCNHLLRVEAGRRVVFKCTEMGITSSHATDIRKKDPACLLFDRKGTAEVRENEKMRRVDADELIKTISRKYEFDIEIAELIEEVDALVENGGGHTGRWIHNAEEPGTFYCSQCGEVVKDTVMGQPKAEYCPQCGSYNGGGYA